MTVSVYVPAGVPGLGTGGGVGLVLLLPPPQATNNVRVMQIAKAFVLLRAPTHMSAAKGSSSAYRPLC